MLRMPVVRVSMDRRFGPNLEDPRLSWELNDRFGLVMKIYPPAALIDALQSVRHMSYAPL
jgi:hypothetical protein